VVPRSCPSTNLGHRGSYLHYLNQELYNDLCAVLPETELGLMYCVFLAYPTQNSRSSTGRAFKILSSAMDEIITHRNWPLRDEGTPARYAKPPYYGHVIQINRFAFDSGLAPSYWAV